MVRVAEGIYKRGDKFYERPRIDGRPTFRLLPARTLTQAKAIYHSRRERDRLAKEGIGESPYARQKAKTIGELLEVYREAGCPDRKRKARTGKQLEQEQSRLKFLFDYWKLQPAATLTMPDLDRYGNTRMGQVKRGTGARAVDLEIQTLANAYSHGVRIGIVPNNPIGSERPRFYALSDARHCRDCAPESTEEFHRLAAALLEEPGSAVLGWQLLFEGMTGVRTNEALNLRWDATKGKPGFIEDGQWLWLQRSKRGVNPFVVLYPELKEMLGGLKEWHKANFPKSPWYFPSPRNEGQSAVNLTSLNHALIRISPLICGGNPRTSHGLRAYYVTLRRSQGIPDGQIAAEIGDKTASLIETTYGSIPPNWRGKKALSWIPSGFSPAWEHFCR